MTGRKLLRRGIPYVLSVSLVILVFSLCAGKFTIVEHGLFAPSRLDSVIGQDGVCSISFSDEITFWTFADTITGKWKSINGQREADINEAVMEGMLSNSIAWSEKINAGNYKTIKLNFYMEKGRTAQFIKNRNDENPLKHRFWALDGFRTGNRLYVYYLHVFVPDHSRPLGFKVLYTGLARWDIPPGWRPGDKINFRRLGPLFGKDMPYFGASVMERGGDVYLAGHFKKSDTEFPVSIAKVQTGKAEDVNSYSFLSKNGKWITDVKNAGAFIGDVSGECSLSFNDYLKEYVIIYSKTFSGNIGLVKFKNFAELPVSGSETIFRVHKTGSSVLWPYSGKEIFSEGRSLFLIYIDPVRYQPLLLEIKY